MQINGRPFNPGELRTKVYLASKSMVKDAGGFQKPGYVLISEAKAKWINVHGQETWAADARGAIKPATVTIRYRAELDETCVVVKGSVTLTEAIEGEETITVISGGDVFEIVSMDNIQERNEYIELKVKGLAGG